MNILITGCAGFIGNSLTQKLLKKNKKIKIIGLDNLNSFYSVQLKKKRLSLIKKFKNFKFYKVDLLEKKKLENIFKKNKIDIIYNFAAQAGVRYVSSHPEKFLGSNIHGFHNLIEVSKKYKIKKFFYASSSSVYGDKNSYPVSEISELKPKNVYGLSKKFNEEYVCMNFNKNTKYIGLRLFTVYGEWGRPDMLILKFLEHAKKNKIFYLNNSGNHWRDFTYIEDVVNVCEKLMTKQYKQNQIFNICNGKPILIKNVIRYLSNKTGFRKIINVKNNNYEVLKTHGKNSKLIRFTKYKNFKNFYEKVDNVIKWYNRYQNFL